jgi:hypothetical protein
VEVTKDYAVFPLSTVPDIRDAKYTSDKNEWIREALITHDVSEDFVSVFLASVVCSVACRCACDWWCLLALGIAGMACLPASASTFECQSPRFQPLCRLFVCLLSLWQVGRALQQVQQLISALNFATTKDPCMRSTLPSA